MTEIATFGARLEGVAYADRPAAYPVVAGENGTVGAVKRTSGKFERRVALPRQAPLPARADGLAGPVLRVART